ncbi:hypothetical protein AXG93_4485s1160 [Marchantia polymorpha subsp. ruderalis]|uniref:Uncharacterized protein n=3 Tax=Marchantia polymorpha TaxID=3197 RepID=A0A176WFS2_MARPO|nr:hypothetical protein AXG93_4485s1160 [Marchantia polymorpha subsp. ruderalis]
MSKCMAQWGARRGPPGLRDSECSTVSCAHSGEKRHAGALGARWGTKNLPDPVHSILTLDLVERESEAARCSRSQSPAARRSGTGKRPSGRRAEEARSEQSILRTFVEQASGVSWFLYRRAFSAMASMTAVARNSVVFVAAALMVAATQVVAQAPAPAPLPENDSTLLLPCILTSAVATVFSFLALRN